MSMVTEMNGVRRCNSLLWSNRAVPRST